MSTAHRRPQLTVDELQQLKWLLGGGLTLVAASTVFYMDIDAWTLMALTFAATLAVLRWPAIPARVPPLVHTLAFPTIVAFFVADLWLKTEILPAMVRLDILLLLYRNITYRQRRDDLQIIVLGLFLIVVAGVLTVSLTFAMHILVYTACALALLLVVTLSDGAGRPAEAKAAERGGPVVPSWVQHANWPHLARRLRDVTDWRVVALGSVLFAGVVAVSALLFLAIPRFQLENSMFLDRFITKKAKSGFSDTIRFGDVTEIVQDTSVALSVDVSEQNQIPQAPYWRMLVLDQYDNGTFRLSAPLRREEFERTDRTGVLQRGRAVPRRGEPVYWTFYLESGVSRYLPLLGPYATLRFREVQNYRVAPALALLALREEPVSMLAYRVEDFDFSPALRDPGFAQRWAARAEGEQRRFIMQAGLNLIGVDREALRQVVAQLTAGATVTAPDFARRASEWLRLNHAYSLSPSIPGGLGDPLVRWMTSREAGHCELFAGSFVLLARTAGFPSRVVTGFRGGSWNGYSNNFTIRNSDAHAWAEIFDEATGAWLRADPLAPATAAQAEEVKGEAAIVSRLDRSWKARLDSLRVFWYRRIVSFDQRSQVETLKAMKEATQNSGRRLRDAIGQLNESIKEWLTTPWGGRRIIKTAITLGLLVAVGWWWRSQGRRWWRDWRPRRGGRHEDPVRREAARWLALLAEGDASMDAADRAVMGELQRLRFGPRPTWREPEKVFRRARHALREARRRARATRS